METNGPLQAVAQVAGLLEGCAARWLVGGSMGLLLRGARLDRLPRDLDLYADAPDIAELHGRLRPFALDEPEANETERYRSVLSHYRVAELTVELVGSFRVRALHSAYATEVQRDLYDDAERVRVGGRELGLVPLGHELIFNLLRERADRAELVGTLIRADSGRHLPSLRKLLERNDIAAAVAARALQLAKDDGASGEGGETS